jgi:CheY-like chemotaxis protein
MGFSEILLQPDLTKEKHEDYVHIINTSSTQLLAIISDIIDISKIEAGQITTHLELVDINNLLHELHTIYNKTVELKKIKLIMSPDSLNDSPHIITDGNKIKQVFCNLLNNAIKFTKEGTIEFGYKIKGDFIEFYVKDTSIGIAPEHFGLVFQRFRQVEITNARTYGGNGLGLSISKALIEKLGGAINVSSELGKGSIFSFSVPFVTETAPPMNTFKKTEPAQLFNWDDKTILLVEDEANNHVYISELLAFTNIQILHAWDGREAVDLVKKHSEISLVLMDIKMPIMDGFEATRMIKQIRSNLPVIAQSAYAFNGDKLQAQEAGCDDYLVKPIKKKNILDLMSIYLN